jgi:hypothetical protein
MERKIEMSVNTAIAKRWFFNNANEAVRYYNLHNICDEMSFADFLDASEFARSRPMVTYTSSATISHTRAVPITYDAREISDTVRDFYSRDLGDTSSSLGDNIREVFSRELNSGSATISFSAGDNVTWEVPVAPSTNATASYNFDRHDNAIYHAVLSENSHGLGSLIANLTTSVSE